MKNETVVTKAATWREDYDWKEAEMAQMLRSYTQGR